MSDFWRQATQAVDPAFKQGYAGYVSQMAQAEATRKWEEEQKRQSMIDAFNQKIGMANMQNLQTDNELARQKFAADQEQWNQGAPQRQAELGLTQARIKDVGYHPPTQLDVVRHDEDILTNPDKYAPDVVAGAQYRAGQSSRPKAGADEEAMIEKMVGQRVDDYVKAMSATYKYDQLTPEKIQEYRQSQYDQILQLRHPPTSEQAMQSVFGGNVQSQGQPTPQGGQGQRNYKPTDPDILEEAKRLKYGNSQQ
jgi:hypothetical protein